MCLLSACIFINQVNVIYTGSSATPGHLGTSAPSINNLHLLLHPYSLAYIPILDLAFKKNLAFLNIVSGNHVNILAGISDPHVPSSCPCVLQIRICHFAENFMFRPNAANWSLVVTPSLTASIPRTNCIISLMSMYSWNMEWSCKLHPL